MTLTIAVVVALTGVMQMVPRWQTADVPLPSADATPEDVVRAYLQAIDVHDCDTAQDLTAPAFASTTETMCHDAASLEITDLTPLPAFSSPLGAAVSAGFDVDWRLLTDDRSIPEGGFTWTYYLTRAGGTHDRWLIDDAGNG
ncbi:hypothetical protein GCM10009809_13680 [Isoptericola hypogeus]|uniref:DUF4829 domain-containing protein n=1 Tax=Isoptericola hypogeus TaxID=300179 RepID=A0ABN2J6T4_9MICO